MFLNMANEYIVKANYQEGSDASPEKVGSQSTNCNQL